MVNEAPTYQAPFLSEFTPLEQTQPVLPNNGLIQFQPMMRGQPQGMGMGSDMYSSQRLSRMPEFNQDRT